MQTLPQEIEVWYLIPAIRSELAKELLKNGINQTKIANLLHLTNAAVSQYISGKRAKDVKIPTDIKQQIKLSVKRILKGNSASKEVQLICNFFKKKGYLCKLHFKKDKSLKKCGACLA